MSDMLSTLLIVALAATVITLVMGVVNLFMTKKGARERSNKLMRWRIVFQSIALVILALLFLIGR